MRYVLALFFAVAGWFALGSSPAFSASMKAACDSLDRTNMDCVCVAKRIDRFEAAAPDAEMVELIRQAYLHSLGQENSYLETFENVMSDETQIMRRMTAFEDVGGRPENIEDFERACVIKGAALPLIPNAPTFPAAQQHIDACIAATSQGRVCQCDAARLSQRLTPKEFEAYHRSFSDYSDATATTLEELSESRGRAMGVSGAEFDRLQATARNKIDPYREADRAYCNALTFADQDEGFTEEQRLTAGFDDRLAVDTETENPTVSGRNPRERMVEICTADQSDPALCECMVSKMESQLSKNDFELMVDLREADMSGADNLMAAVARKRGVSETAVQQQVMQNPSLMSGMMGMNMMECIGGLPDLSGLPGFSTER